MLDQDPGQEEEPEPKHIDETSGGLLDDMSVTILEAEEEETTKDEGGTEDPSKTDVIETITAEEGLIEQEAKVREMLGS